MIQDTSSPAPVQYPKLILHCGGREASLDEIERVRTPKASPTWNPVPHIDVIKHVKTTAEQVGFRIVHETHALARDGARYFGLMAVAPAQKSKSGKPYDLVLGLRSSHDKTFPITLGAGSRVFACDNLAFSAEVEMRRKHTVHAARDLPGLLAQGMGRLTTHWNNQDTRFEAYRKREITDKEAHDIMVRAVRTDALTPSDLKNTIEQWHDPRHEEFRPRTAWSLFNAFTDGMKERNMPLVATRTVRLHALMDTVCDLALNS